MKMKNLFQHRLALLWCRFFQVHPKKEIGVGQQGRHQKDVKVLGVQPALSGKRKRPNHFPRIFACRQAHSRVYSSLRSSGEAIGVSRIDIRREQLCSLIYNSVPRRIRNATVK
jgi:hypothetical protein